MPPDFSRDLRFVLGLPFDALTEARTEGVVRTAIDRRTRCFLSTPNLNFVVACLADASFRSSVLQSDLSVADGWPVVAISRLVGSALPERVSGSSLFQRLAASPLRPAIGVFFFGGAEGAAQTASERINAAANCGVRCTGHASPGFGSVADMSTPAQLDRVNRARADFVVVSVGAKKGQAWIRHNLEALEAPVIGYLGAVVNFTAGVVPRAPNWVQAARLEWLWRIKEEPSLWRRYAADGATLLRLLATRVAPLMWQNRLQAPDAGALARAAITRRGASPGATLHLAGAWTHANAAALRAEFAQQAASRSGVVLDLAEVSHLDGTVLALMALLFGWQVKIGAAWQVVNVPTAVRETMQRACADYLLDAHGTG
jgi:N-acetylglucosaminyldiphosphoundecaprenol N-acetyl-beta-D-mannosaminyltransferase